jgi:hypothetical protein
MSATALAPHSDFSKWEPLRRLRYGAMIRLFRHRWGHALPEDDAGHGDLWPLVLNVSLAAAEPLKKMGHVIEVWAPWMTSEHAADLIRHVWGLDRYQRIQTAEELGRHLGITNAVRQQLGLWPFKPTDATDEELEAQRKARRSERRSAKRRANGVRPRAAYLAEIKSKPKPWEAVGISRRTYYRRVAGSGSSNSY